MFKTCGTTHCQAEHDEDIQELVAGRSNSISSDTAQANAMRDAATAINRSHSIARGESFTHGSNPAAINPIGNGNLGGSNAFLRRGSAAPLPGIGGRHGSVRNLSALDARPPAFQRANTLSSMNHRGSIGGGLAPLSGISGGRKDAGAAVREIIASSRQMLVHHPTVAV